MKRIIGLLLVMAMVFSLNVTVYATEHVSVDEEEMLRAISDLDESFQNEDGCYTKVVSIIADGNNYLSDEHMSGNTRSTSVPTVYYNIAQNGIYKGSFSSLRGRIYTNKYFDMQDGGYYSRVRCYGEYPNLTYKVGNYCVTCKKVLSTSESDYYTPSTTWERGNWVSFHHTVGSSHTSHFVCPFVTNTSGSINDQLYAIGGDIWVNYTSSWS